MGIPWMTDNKMIIASEAFENAKAPGLDGIPNRALKMVIKHCVRPFTKVYKKCFEAGVFSKYEVTVETLYPIRSIERQSVEIDENDYSTHAIDPVMDNEVILALECFGSRS